MPDIEGTHFTVSYDDPVGRRMAELALKLIDTDENGANYRAHLVACVLGRACPRITRNEDR